MADLPVTTPTAEKHLCSFFFFFNDTATTEIYTLSLHDALPISPAGAHPRAVLQPGERSHERPGGCGDRKSTRLNSSHLVISYAVFCLKKKKDSTTTFIVKHPNRPGTNLMMLGGRDLARDFRNVA